MIPIYVLNHEAQTEVVFDPHQLPVGDSPAVQLMRVSVEAVRSYVMEPFDDLMRKGLHATIQLSINQLTSLRDIAQGTVVCDLSNNSEDRLARNQVVATIAVSMFGWPPYMFSVSNKSMLN